MRSKFIALLILILVFIHPSTASAQDFHDWLRELRLEAIQCGISEKLVMQALPDTLSLNEKIIRLDRKQPENTISFSQYKKNVLTPARLVEGRRQMHLYKKLLEQIYDIYRVEPQYIVALWGIETGFGTNTGGFETIPALVTLAYDGRRSIFFRQELFKALKIIDQGNIGLHQMKGSWAGAMGQCQFMPTSFEKFAQDFDKDGKKDIWDTEADVFASTAAYLATSGWKNGQPWAFPIQLPKGFDEKLIGSNIQKPLEFWRGAGIPLHNVEAGILEPISIVQPGGKGYKTYAVTENYRILLKWNTSLYFATAVGLFADQLKD